MYTGHFAVALAAKGAVRRLPLALLIAAAFASDLVEAGVAALNVVDRSRVWSHSLPATVAVGALLGAVWRWRGGSLRESLVLGGVAVSHTALDLVTGRKAIWPGTPRLGLGLYERPWVDTAVECAIVVVAWLVWKQSLAPRQRSGRDVLAMLAVLLAFQFAAGIHNAFGLGNAVETLSKFVR